MTILRFSFQDARQAEIARIAWQDRLARISLEHVGWGLGIGDRFRNQVTLQWYWDDVSTLHVG